MFRLRPGLALISALVALVLLAGVAPALAHTAPGALLLDASPAAAVEGAAANALPPPTLSATPASSGIPWLGLAGALILAALGWRRPRRTLVLAVVLLLAVFAFEDGLHSVHHLFDESKLTTCAVAAATAHLHATAADGGAVTDVILSAPGVSMDADPSTPDARFPSPVQGRAPPTRFA